VGTHEGKRAVISPQPERWLTAVFPGNGAYLHDNEFARIDAYERALPARVPVLRNEDEFLSSSSEIAQIRTEIQVATQQCNAAYLHNLRILLANIGALRRSRAVTWCGFGAYGSTDPAHQATMPCAPQPLYDDRRRMLAALLCRLDGQAQGGPPGSREVHAALGGDEPAKRWLVGHACRVLASSLDRPWLAGVPTIPPDLRLGERLLGSSDPMPDGEALNRYGRQLTLSSEARAIRRLLDRPDDQPCHFRFERWIANIIAAIGAMDPNRHAAAETAVSLASWQAVLAVWTRAINAWLDEVQVERAAGAAGDMSIARDAYGLLGEQNDTKVWLVASLSKTMRSIGDDYRPKGVPAPRRFAGD